METADGSKSDMEAKWGRLVAQRGFAQIPNYLLLVNQFIAEEHRLTPVESLVAIHLAASWWKKDVLPFPSMLTLSRRLGVSERQVQRAINKLQKLGMITKVKRRRAGIIESNAYDLSGMVSLLTSIAEQNPNLFPRGMGGATPPDEAGA
ncbi:AraC-like DNA-binding protein [Azospirillum agricola]|uniref:helix-turn-helix domain-containing protein n=1 Tax=Azospirillum agricola TaxID=1720247 RepID=UPI001AE753A1|nr:helix-turn-helix domain-containing protein [Azospirillum agricola]MBP2233442.1 AraC-like DNA-binding protein [Azospirillum agricola]